MNQFERLREDLAKMLEGQIIDRANPFDNALHSAAERIRSHDLGWVSCALMFIILKWFAMYTA